ncbi:MAG: cytochrome c [Cyclobacteriaceae bacterium]|nr:cytochrome c [Cyclobacteriaceae bacterium]
MILDFRFLIVGISLFILINCSQTKTESANKFTNYYRQGEQLYTKNCSNCHQPNGSGLGRVYPPINQSDYMQENFEQVLCLIRNGTQGGLTVNGTHYNQAMPGVPSLTDIEIAQIATYIYNTWSHQRGIVEVTEASRILKQCE